MIARMLDVLFKSLGWFVFMVLILTGFWCISEIETHGFISAFFAVLSFGAAYILSGPWRRLPKMQMVLSVLLVFCAGFLAFHLSEVVYILTGNNIHFPGLFVNWIGLMFVAGIPFMMFVFARYGED